MEYLMIAVFMCIALTTIVCGGINTVLSQNGLKIEVRPNPDRGWQVDTTKDLESLLMKSAEVINDTLRVPFNGEIEVVENDSEGPMVYERSPGESVFLILLGLSLEFPTYCPRIVYQFAHEFCHILSNFEAVSKHNPNTWFHEAICELASGYVLLEGQQHFNYEWLWPNGEVPGETTTDYWKGEIERARKDSEVRNYWEDEKGNISVSLNEWLEKHEDQLQKQLDSYGWWNPEEETQKWRNHLWNAGEETQKWRNHFVYVARVLLPIFIKDPSGWNAIRKLPASRGMLREYLQDWHKQVDDSDKEFVKKVASKFGYTVE